jgi:hypothetical protein
MPDGRFIPECEHASGAPLLDGQHGAERLPYGVAEMRTCVCAHCGARHILMVGDINARRPVEFGCSGCGEQVVMAYPEADVPATAAAASMKRSERSRALRSLAPK